MQAILFRRWPLPALLCTNIPVPIPPDATLTQRSTQYALSGTYAARGHYRKPAGDAAARLPGPLLFLFFLIRLYPALRGYVRGGGCSMVLLNQMTGKARLGWVRVIVVHPQPVSALLTGVRKPVVQHEVKNFRFVRRHGALDHLRQRCVFFWFVCCWFFLGGGGGGVSVHKWSQRGAFGIDLTSTGHLAAKVALCMASRDVAIEGRSKTLNETPHHHVHRD